MGVGNGASFGIMVRSPGELRFGRDTRNVLASNGRVKTFIRDCIKFAPSRMFHLEHSPATSANLVPSQPPPPRGP